MFNQYVEFDLLFFGNILSMLVIFDIAHCQNVFSLRDNVASKVESAKMRQSPHLASFCYGPLNLFTQCQNDSHNHRQDQVPYW